MSTKWRWAAGALGTVVLGEAALIRLGRTYGSTEEERSEGLQGDGIVNDPKVVTDHAITIGAPLDYERRREASEVWRPMW